MKQYIKLLKSLYLNIPSPISVSVNLTNKCNQHCTYCEVGQGLVKTEKPLLVLDDLKWIIDEMNRLGIPTLSLGGGEPLLFKDIFEVIRYAYKLGIKCGIMTNGMLLPRLSQDKIELLKECNYTVSVSIDSFSTDKEEYIRGAKNAVSLPIEGIKLFIRQQIPVNIMTVISAHNYQDLFDIVVNANRLGVDSVNFQPVIFVSCFPEVEPIPNKKSFNVQPDHLREIEDQFQRILDFERNNPINTNVYVLRQWLPDYIQFLSSMQTDDFFFKKIVNRFWCAPLYSTIAINYYGDILPCNMLKPAKSIRDRDGKSLLELWNASCKPVRSMIKRKRYPDACKSCVCAFDFNVLCSTLKYPFNNSHLLSKVLVESVKRRIGR
jgi:MoaA/NifB/PqqE/SkfB family radical SAM enzyme